MSDLISRNALLDAMPKNDELLSVDVRRIICESPKVDAEPVRHGCWKRIDFSVYKPAICSCCGVSQFIDSNYCPNYGANMRGDGSASE